jgi:hypothetical protein
VFCRFDLNNCLPILQTCLTDLVQIAGAVVPMETEEIKSLQGAEAEDLHRRPCGCMQLGQSVRIEQGPLAGLRGVLSDFKGQARLVVSVTLLGRSVAVEIDSRWASVVSKDSAQADSPELNSRIIALAGLVGPSAAFH